MTLLDFPTASFTADEFDRMIDSGVFGKRRVALINGVIVDMPAQGEPHWIASYRTANVLQRILGDGWIVRQMAPLRADALSQPEPDILVYRGSETDFLGTRPQTGDLLVEISDSTLRADRQVMSKLYATAGVPEYWIVNIPDRQLEVFRDPEPAAGRYRIREIYLPGQLIAPLAKPDARIDPHHLLP